MHQILKYIHDNYHKSQFESPNVQQENDPIMSSGKHTIILVQYTGSYNSRSYLDFPSVGEAMDGNLILMRIPKIITIK